MTPNNNTIKFPIHSFKILVGIVGLFALTTVATAESVQARETAPTPQRALQQDALNHSSRVIIKQTQNIKRDSLAQVGASTKCHLPPRRCN
jgi:uncharacterized lipoprotein YajG